GGPLRGDGSFRALLLISNLHSESWNSSLDETVLIAADESISLGLRIGLYFEAQLLGSCANIGAEVRFIETEHHQHLQWEQRKEHVRIDIRDDGAGRDWRVGNEITRTQFALLF